MVLRWLPVVIWIGVILGLSSIPSLGPAGQLFTGSDKIVHMIEYGVLGFVFARACRLRDGSLWRAALIAAALGLTIGVGDELYQRSVPGRTSDPYDALADGVGAALGSVVRVRWSRRAVRARTRSG